MWAIEQQQQQQSQPIEPTPSKQAVGCFC